MPSVLVVDDLVTDRHLAGSLLKKDPQWSVRYANDGRQGLESIQDSPPDVVVTDLMMPEMNGLQLVRAIADEFPLLPVIIMTSQGNEEIAVEALEAGAASYVPKHILAKDLLRIVERVFSASQAEHSQAELMNCVSRDELIELKSDPSKIAPVVNHLRRTYCSFGLCSQRRSVRIATALDEALTNAVYHGALEIESNVREKGSNRFHELARQRCQQPPFNERQVHVMAKFSRSSAAVTIRDEGPGFDISSLPDPTDPENFCRPYGRGIMLMRMFMDEVVFNSRGNEVTLILRCAEKPGDLKRSLAKQLGQKMGEA